ncbi:hypothetical protein AAKU55_003598 [Oxalobacteraceae bacterium GrIS 1.11]
MFNIFILAVMVSLAAFYSSDQPRQEDLNAQARTRALASDMAVYREAVVRYFALPDNKGSEHTTVDGPTLASAGLLPSWSPLAATGDGATWANLRDDHIVYIYAKSALPVGVLSDLLALSKNSSQVGQYHVDCQCFQSALSAPVTKKLTSNNIPNGSPVWIARSY